MEFPDTCRGCDAMGYEILLRLSGARCAGLWEFPGACRSVARLYYEILRCSSGRGWSGAASFPVEVRWNWHSGFSGACRGAMCCGNPWRSPKCGCTGAVMVPADGWRSWPLDGGVRGHCNFRKIKAAGGKAAVRGRGETGSLFGFKAQGGEEFFHHSDEFVRAEVLRFGRGIVVQVNDDAAIADGHIGVEHLQILNFLHVGFR